MPQSEGYLFVDHRASPGLPETVAVRAGYDPALCREGKIFEAATFRCPHCATHFIKNPERQRKRETCVKCSGRYICDLCYAKTQMSDYVHTPFQKLVDAAKDAEAKGTPWLIPKSVR